MNVTDASQGPDGMEPLVPGPPPPTPRATRRIQRVADRMPAWTGSIRFRLTAIYSLWLFGLAALVVGGIYLGISRRLAHDSVSPDQVSVLIERGNGQLDPGIAASAHDIQHLANEHTLDTLRMTSFTALSLLFLSSLVVGWVVAGRVLAPIGRITAVAREIQATDLSRRIALSGPADELRELADTFDSMLARLDEAFEGQRRFIHEASHELRNPLAVIRTNLDVTLADPDASADDLRAAADVVRRSTERISRLVDDLLVYADRGSPVREHVPVDVATVVDATVAEFFVPAATNGLALTSASDRELWVLGDRDALRRVVANLLAERGAPGAARLARCAWRPAGPTTGCGWRSTTPGPASPPTSASRCSSASGAATPPRPAPRGAVASASPSSARSPRPTVASCACGRRSGAGRRSWCGSRPRRPKAPRRCRRSPPSSSPARPPPCRPRLSRRRRQ